MNCLLTGASGNLGRKIAELWPLFFPVSNLFKVHRAHLELADGSTLDLGLNRITDISKILQITAPDVIIHCAAISSPIEAEASPREAWYIHSEVATLFSQYVQEQSGWMLYCSSDFVFDGGIEGFYSEEAPTHPATQYGKSKLSGEREVLTRNAGLVVRLSLMFDPPLGSASGWSKLRTALEYNEPVEAVTDEWRTPLRYKTAAENILRLTAQKRRGIVNVAGVERLTPYDLIVRLKAEIGSKSAIVPVLRRRISPNVDRPRSVALSTKLLKEWLADDYAESTSTDLRGRFNG